MVGGGWEVVVVVVGGEGDVRVLMFGWLGD